MPRFTTANLLMLTTVVAVSLGVWVSLPREVRGFIYYQVLPLVIFPITVLIPLGVVIWFWILVWRLVRLGYDNCEESSRSD